MAPIEVSTEGIRDVEAMKYYADWRTTLQTIEGDDPKNPVPSEFVFTSKFDSQRESQDVSAAEKLIVAAIEKIRKKFVGDGSLAHAYFGHQASIPNTDRAVLLLASLTNTSPHENWSKLTSLSVGLNQGESLQTVETHMTQQATGTIDALLKIPFIKDRVSPEEKEKALEDIREEITETKNLWGDTDETLRKHKKEADEQLQSTIFEKLADPNTYTSVSQWLNEMIKFTPQVYTPAIIQAQYLLSQIPNPKEDPQKGLSTLGRALFLKDELAQATPRSPENPQDLLFFISDEVKKLKNIDFYQIAAPDAIQKDQIQRRKTIITAILAYVTSPEILLACVNAKCRLEKAINLRENNKRKYPDLKIWNSSSPTDAGIYHTKVLEHAPTLIEAHGKSHGITQETLLQSAVITGILPILQEIREDFQTAGNTLTHIVDASRKKQREFFRKVRWDPMAMKKFGLTKQPNPQQFSEITPEIRRLMEGYIRSMPDFYSNDLDGPDEAFHFLQDTFGGDLYPQEAEKIDVIYKGFRKLLETYLKNPASET